jgi:hypothetical protein
MKGKRRLLSPFSVTCSGTSRMKTSIVNHATLTDPDAVDELQDVERSRARAACEAEES